MVESKKTPIVNVFNEWDPLEEIIVGRVENAMIPKWHKSMAPTIPEKYHNFFKENSGIPFPRELISSANDNLNEFIKILEGEGVTVRRPDAFDFSQSYSNPYWSEPNGFYAAMPRDILFVYGDEIIEAPTVWRSRYYETFAYRKLLNFYFQNGAKWYSPPKPQLKDEIYIKDEYKEANEFNSVITEAEPAFDAADFVRCGKDIIGQLSHVTNQAGVDWIKRHLGDKYNVHIFKFNDTHQMHIDTTITPLAPGKLLVHPDKFFEVPRIFRSWDIIKAPLPCLPDDVPLFMTSKWISMNIIMLDEERAIVEKSETSLAKILKAHGFKVILCNFKHFNSFGGSFHCATMDIRRKGELKSYCD